MGFVITSGRYSARLSLLKWLRNLSMSDRSWRGFWEAYISGAARPIDKRSLLNNTILSTPYLTSAASVIIKPVPYIGVGNKGSLGEQSVSIVYEFGPL